MIDLQDPEVQVVQYDNYHIYLNGLSSEQLRHDNWNMPTSLYIQTRLEFLRVLRHSAKHLIVRLAGLIIASALL